MRVILVTWTNRIAENMAALNPDLEYCAIATDDVAAARRALEGTASASLRDVICPFYELKECVNNFYYDYVICVENGWAARALLNEVHKLGVDKDKVIHFCALPFMRSNFSVDYSLRYFKAHAAEFDMFATGISYSMMGLEVGNFKRRLFNFSAPSQDLYYNLKTAKYVIGCKADLHCALIGLAPYSFQFDESKASNNKFYMLQNYIAFKDLHNFPISAGVYRNFFRRGTSRGNYIKRLMT